MLVFVLLEVKVNNSLIKYCLKVAKFDISLLQVAIRSYINIVTGFFFRKDEVVSSYMFLKTETLFLGEDLRSLAFRR